MISSISLQTQRLKLKPVTPLSVTELFYTKTEQEIAAQFGLNEKGFEYLKTMYAGGLESYSSSFHYFLLCDKENETVLGECGYHSWNKRHAKAEIFYNLRSDAVKQKGYMKEALGEVLRFGFTELKLHRIEAKVSDTNIPSVKLLQHYGFKKEGTKKEDYFVDGIYEDSDFYALLKAEWEERK